MERPKPSRAPFGLGSTKPKHYREMARVAWRNRDQLPFAWRILRDGVCDGCALGTSGLRDWTIPGVHLCMVRLELLRLNTMPAIGAAALRPTSELAALSESELRALGRLDVPLLRRKGDDRFRELSWSDAIELAAQRLSAVRQHSPEAVTFYLTSRGIPNETYYVAQKAARRLGTPHVDNSARLCHAASTVALKRALGHGASTGSYSDWIEADLIVFFGSNVPNNQPVSTKYLEAGKKRGLEIALVNPVREPGFDRYWVPSSARSSLFGTALCDHHFGVHVGGDLHFLHGVLKSLTEVPGGVDREFVSAHTVGFDECAQSVRRIAWTEIERGSGAKRDEIERFARLLVEKPRTIFVWSMGLTQHVHGVDTVQALVNVALARGLPGRRGSGLTPIRGHSGVQGGAEVGCVPVDDARTLDLWRDVWGFDPPRASGWSTVAQLEASARGEVDVLWAIGGNFLGTLGNDKRTRAALATPALRVHQDIVLNPSMLIDPSDTLLILPAATRYETPGGVTETTTERRIVFSPEIPGRRLRCRPEWEVLCEVVAAATGDESFGFADTAAIREEMSRAVPLYDGIQALHAKGDQFQWGGERLYADGRFATADGLAHFVTVHAPSRTENDGDFRLTTRRGKQFNSMVQAELDPLTGTARDAIFISSEDVRRLELEEGTRVELRSQSGSFVGRLRLAPIRPGNLAVHWPEGNELLTDLVDSSSGEPDYGARVSLQSLDS